MGPGVFTALAVASVIFEICSVLPLRWTSGAAGHHSLSLGWVGAGPPALTWVCPLWHGWVALNSTQHTKSLWPQGREDGWRGTEEAPIKGTFCGHPWALFRGLLDPRELDKLDGKLNRSFLAPVSPPHSASPLTRPRPPAHHPLPSPLASVCLVVAGQLGSLLDRR